MGLSIDSFRNGPRSASNRPKWHETSGSVNPKQPQKRLTSAQNSLKVSKMVTFSSKCTVGSSKINAQVISGCSVTNFRALWCDMAHATPPCVRWSWNFTSSPSLCTSERAGKAREEEEHIEET